MEVTRNLYCSVDDDIVHCNIYCSVEKYIYVEYASGNSPMHLFHHFFLTINCVSKCLIIEKFPIGSLLQLNGHVNSCRTYSILFPIEGQCSYWSLERTERNATLTIECPHSLLEIIELYTLMSYYVDAHCIAFTKLVFFLPDSVVM